uniref:Replication factor A C-terminal domain-containing protein n=1 Tax=Tanacetum cinerariifolium TaxID=118510 RepID=A0A6L2P5L2_TANCI|nr:hypothetical protein [Tanacetum cinerariifolium]
MQRMVLLTLPARHCLRKYRLELSIFDRTAVVVAVMFDETATELVKVPADSILKVEDEINPTEPVEESACSSTDDAIADKHFPSLKRLIDLEDSDTEAAFGSSKEADEDEKMRTRLVLLQIRKKRKWIAMQKTLLSFSVFIGSRGVGVDMYYIRIGVQMDE